MEIVDSESEDKCEFQQTFDVLKKAIEHAELHPNAFIASFEVDLSGKRRYIVTSISRFWSFYKGLKKRNHYEVIRPNRKLKLFLDLEFYLDENPNKDGIKMTKLVINHFNRVLEEKFQYKNDLSDVLILDSSRQSKYSIHLIFKKVVFEDIQSVKNFVEIVLKNLTDQDRQSLKVVRKDKTVNFVDQAVYGQFQNFRMFMSEKLGSSAALRVASFDSSTHQQEKSTEEEQFDIFTSSLISYFIDENIQTFAVASDKVSAQKVNKKEYIQCSGPSSPYPEVEKYITEVIQPGSYIVRWNYYKSTETFGFIVSGNRFCRNIGGAHKTQRILFTFCPKSLSVVQGCFSGQCKDFKSEPFVLPTEMFQWMEMDIWEEQ